MRDPLGVGSRFQGHELGAVLARSALAVVFLAVERRSGARVAIKAPAPEYASDPGLRERLRHERAVGAELRHPHLVRVREAPQDPDRPCVVSDYIPGRSLRELLSARLSQRQALLLVHQLCACLDYLHAGGASHGRLTPGHVQVTPDGEARILDLAYATTAAHAVSPAAAGPSSATVAYLAPEQVAGRPAGPAADVYALGVMFQELLTGATPFTGMDPSSILRLKLCGAPLPGVRAPVDAELEELIREATAREPLRRPRAGQLLAALDRHHGGAPPAGCRGPGAALR